MLSFGLCSTSDDQLSNLSDESRLKCEKRPPKSSKNEMLVFGLHSTSDDQPSNPSNESQLKCDNRPPKSLKMKYSFLYYVQLLMISQMIRVTKVYQNVKISNIVSVRVFCCFRVGLLLFQSGSSVHPHPLPPDGKVGIRITEKFRFFRLMFNKFQPKDNSVQSLLHLWQCSSFVMGNVPIGSPYTFTIYSIHVMANLST